MIVCPECTTDNIEGAFFCENCGSPLQGVDFIASSTSSTNIVGSSAPMSQQPVQLSRSRFQTDTTIFLSIGASNTRLELPLMEEVVLGRNDERTNTYPDIDLTPFEAIENGVSRTHAAIRRLEDSATLEDLSSANGTYLNGQRLSSNQPRILRDGDEVRFGKLVFRLYFA